MGTSKASSRGEKRTDLGVKGRRAIVTGNSSGIGFETARQYREEGVRVLITGRNEKKLMQARDDLPSAPAARSMPWSPT